MKQFYLLMIWQIHLMSQKTFKKINWLFLLSPIDTDVKNLRSFHSSLVWKKNKVHVCLNLKLKEAALGYNNFNSRAFSFVTW